MVALPITPLEQDMGRVVNRLAEVKAAKKPSTPWDEIARETGLAYTTVLRWAKNQVDRYDDKALAKFCEYFEVGVGDILEYRADEKG